jgi:hypothetical protein
MSIWIDQQYIGLLSNRLLRFKQKDKDLYNFRCPFCLDSQKSKTKARGWIFNKGGKFRYYCHNCSASMLFTYFLKSIDVDLHDNFIKEKFIEDNINNPKVESKPDITKFSIPKFMSGTSPLKQLKKVSSLPIDHPFKKYVMSRKIPSHHQYRLFYCESFKKWVNSFIPNKFDNLEKDHPRLIIPFIDRDKNFFGCQGRSLSSTGIRYITIIVDESRPRVFGLDTCDLSKDSYVFEGPIDSLFFDNAIAMCGSDLSKSIDVDKTKTTIVFDNEPRSNEIVKKMSKYTDDGYKICIWPEKILQKDVNEMILSGYEPEELKIIVDKNTFSGIDAKLRIEMWRKC